MHFEYSTLCPPKPVAQPLISRFYAHNDTPNDSPIALTTNSYLTPGSGTGTPPSQHQWQAPAPCREDPCKSVIPRPHYFCIIPPPAKA